jgi:mono/diheme cytochrome c family protein
MTDNPSDKQYGILGEFETVGEILSAAETVRNSGYTKWDCHTPMPVHGLDQAMGVKATRLPWLVLAAGLTGGAFGVLLQWWTNGYDYVYRISGKPDFSLPANIPVAFETTILFAALMAFLSMWILNALPRWFSPWARNLNFHRSTDDRFFIAIQANDPNFHPETTAKMLASIGAASVELVADPDETSKPPAWFTNSLVIGAVLLFIPILLVAMAMNSTSETPRVHWVKDMDFQQKFRPQSVSSMFADGRTSRVQIEGTLALEDDQLVGDPTGLYTGKVNNVYLEKAPFPIDRAFVKRGQERFNIYCSVCHGFDGAGEGTVNLRAKELEQGLWIQPTDLHSVHLGAQPKGQLFESISIGVRNMPGYATQMTAEDRWAVVYYLDALRGTRPQVAEIAVDPNLSPEAQAGQRLFQMKICATCHTTDGTPKVGPSMKGLFGSERELVDGSKVIADEAYLLESIKDPLAKTAKGAIPGAMLPDGGLPLTDEERANLIEYIKTLADQ